MMITTTEVLKIPRYVAGTWTIDRVHSSVGFVIRHLMVSKVRGRFDSFEGRIVTTDDPLESRVTASIDLSSINTGNQQRDDHLRSADFFEIDKYPTMTYRSSGLRVDGDGLVLDGELTLKGVTLPVPLKLEVNGFGPDPLALEPTASARAGFTATGEINRMDFGVSYNGPVRGRRRGARREGADHPGDRGLPPDRHWPRIEPWSAEYPRPSPRPAVPWRDGTQMEHGRQTADRGRRQGRPIPVAVFPFTEIGEAHSVPAVGLTTSRSSHPG
jgi:polyisoprenoid-binding protein YceI